MALIDSIERSVAKPIAQPKILEQPVQAQPQVDKAQPQQAQVDNLQQAPLEKAAPQALIAKQLQTDAFETPVRGRTNLTGTTPREQAVSNAETAALGRLTETQRDQYLNTREALANDPAAQSALRSMLLNGKLTRSEASDGSGNVLDQLDKLASPDTTTIDGVDKTQLLSQVVKDISRPYTIEQGKGNYFCGATAALTGLAYKNPAEYARIAVGLGTEGRVGLAGHYQRDAADGSFQKDDQIVLEVQAESIGDKRRSVTQQLMAPALTEVGNGENYKVDAGGTSHNTFGHGPDHVRGTYADQVALMQQALTGEDHKGFRLDREEPEQKNEALEAAKKLVTEQVAAGVQVAVKKAHEGDEAHGEHWYTVTAINDGQATVVDGEGNSTTMSLDELLDGADAITYDANVSKPAPTIANQEVTNPEKPGGGTRSNGGSIDPGD